MNMNKKGLLCVFLLALLLLSGCTSLHYENVERRALKYYKEKYGLKDVDIKRSYKAGNNGMFGYTETEDRAYEMSDGYSVYWNNTQKYFADDRQAEEIKEDFDSEILVPMLDKVTKNRLVAAYDLNRTAMTSFDHCVFTSLYEGDIKAYLEKEKARPYDLRIFLEKEEGVDHEQRINEFNEVMSQYLDGSCEFTIFEAGSGMLSVDFMSHYIRACDQDVVAIANPFFSRGVDWYRNVFIEVLKGVYVMSYVPNFVLEEGDILLEEAGKAEELQTILDADYYALPVDAEENKNAYLVPDQRHANRYVLDNPELPYYRLLIKQRVIDAMDDFGLNVFVKMKREGEDSLYARYSDSNVPYELVKCGENGRKITFATVSQDSLYYIGTIHLEKYQDS